jgi:hypothetical protein
LSASYLGLFAGLSAAEKHLKAQRARRTAHDGGSVGENSC